MAHVDEHPSLMCDARLHVVVYVHWGSRDDCVFMSMWTDGNQCHACDKLRLQAVGSNPASYFLALRLQARGVMSWGGGPSLQQLMQVRDDMAEFDQLFDNALKNTAPPQRNTMTMHSRRDSQHL